MHLRYLPNHFYFLSNIFVVYSDLLTTVVKPIDSLFFFLESKNADDVKLYSLYWNFKDNHTSFINVLQLILTQSSPAIVTDLWFPRTLLDYFHSCKICFLYCMYMYVYWDTNSTILNCVYRKKKMCALFHKLLIKKSKHSHIYLLIDKQFQ